MLFRSSIDGCSQRRKGPIVRRLGVICIHRQNSWWMESGEEMWRGGSEPSLRWAAILSVPCKHRHSSCSRLEGSRHPGTRSNAGACSLTRAIAPSRKTRDSAPLSTSLSNRLVHLRGGLPRLYKPVLEELRELVCWAYLFLGVLTALWFPTTTIRWDSHDKTH